MSMHPSGLSSGRRLKCCVVSCWSLALDCNGIAGQRSWWETGQMGWMVAHCLNALATFSVARTSKRLYSSLSELLSPSGDVESAASVFCAT